MSFALNQIVRGARSGTFVIVGFRTIDGETHAQVKSVNPSNHSQVARGEMALPVSALRAL